MMATIPVMSILSRRGATFTQSAVVNPEHVLRVFGLPISGLLFVIFFIFAMRHLRWREKLDQRAAPAVLKN